MIRSKKSSACKAKVQQKRSGCMLEIVAHASARTLVPHLLAALTCWPTAFSFPSLLLSQHFRAVAVQYTPPPPLPTPNPIPIPTMFAHSNS
jgi:hypothetical protein